VQLCAQLRAEAPASSHDQRQVAARIQDSKYGASWILVARPDGSPVGVIDVPLRFVTNVDFGATEDVLYVTAVDHVEPPGRADRGATAPPRGRSHTHRLRGNGVPGFMLHDAGPRPRRRSRGIPEPDRHSPGESQEASSTNSETRLRLERTKCDGFSPALRMYSLVERMERHSAHG
jgi:hypothetical protein